MDFRAMLMKRKVNKADMKKIKLYRYQCQNPLFNQVKQKKIVVKKIEWLEVSSHLLRWKTSLKRRKSIWQFFKKFQKWKWLLESWLHREWGKFLGREIMVWPEKYLLGPILEFPQWDTSNFPSRRYLAILGRTHRVYFLQKLPTIRFLPGSDVKADSANIYEIRLNNHQKFGLWIKNTSI